MKIPPRSRRVAMPQRCLHHMQRRSPIHRVRGVGVPEPVRTYSPLDTRPRRCRPNDAVDLGGIKRPAPLTNEYRVIPTAIRATALTIVTAPQLQ